MTCEMLLQLDVSLKQIHLSGWVRGTVFQSHPSTGLHL